MTIPWKTLKKRAFEAIDTLRDSMIELSERIGDNPEVAFQEHNAAQWISDVFKRMGFRVERPFAGLETAFRATMMGGKAGPNLGFIVEYDALPGLGHACGHNTKGSSTWGAVAGILAALPEFPGTVSVFGTPAEESGGGKIIMANKGAFDDLDVALAIGLGPINMTGLATLTAQELVMTFKGKAAHAQAKPHTGQNALKACIATFNLIDMLRQQMKQDVRINGIILDGGETPGAIPERSVAHFNIGCLDGNEHRQLFDQIKSCAVAACQATCCKVEFEAGLVFQEMKLNPTLINIIESKMEEVGLEVSKNRDINGGTGHTDVGNVSQVVAADNIFIEMGADLMPHTVEYREACRSELGHNAIMNGARVGALCGLEIFTHPELVEAIHKDFNG